MLVLMYTEMVKHNTLLTFVLVICVTTLTNMVALLAFFLCPVESEWLQLVHLEEGIQLPDLLGHGIGVKYSICQSLLKGFGSCIICIPCLPPTWGRLCFGLSSHCRSVCLCHEVFCCAICMHAAQEGVGTSYNTQYSFCIKKYITVCTLTVIYFFIQNEEKNI